MTNPKADPLREALALARKRIEYLGSFVNERHQKANEGQFFPMIDAALASQPAAAPVGDREKIARIIDPYALGEEDTAEYTYNLPLRKAEALTLADAILAVTPGGRALSTPSDRELYDNGCITRHQLKNWIDSDYANHIGGLKHTIEFLLTKLDALSTPPVVAGADREIVAWQYRCMFDKGSARQDEWCEWHITSQKHYDKIVDEIRSGRERVQVRALVDAGKVGEGK